MKEMLDKAGIREMLSVTMNPYLKNEIYQITNWLQVDGGIHISAFHYQAKRWYRPRRIIVVRQSIIKPKAMGKMLFPRLSEYCVYRYQVYATNMDLPAVDVWRLYGGRPEKVLKLSAVPRRRPRLDGLFSRAEGLSPPMLAKFHEI